MNLRRPLALIPLLLLTAASPAQAQLAWQSLSPVTVLDGLNGPIDFAISPAGKIWWNEYYTGNVTRYDPADGSRTVVFHADPIEKGVERGMVGLALDPDVDENGVFYVYYTVADPDDPKGGTNVLSRIEDGKETQLLTLSAAVRHNGGRILFTPEGTMFVSTGENELGDPAQDPKSLLGKILHLHPDGRPAEGNVDGFVYSLGHRNVYGLAYDPETKRLFATENGNAERDEVNLIEAGANYGWPVCEGTVKFDWSTQKDTDEPCDDPRFTPPIGEFYTNRTAAPTGAIIFRGDLLWASWNEGAIHRMAEDANGNWVDDVIYRRGGRINDLEAGHDGRTVYYSNWTHILRLDVPESLTLPRPSVSPTPSAIADVPDPPRAGALGAALALVAVMMLAAAVRRRR